MSDLSDAVYAVTVVCVVMSVVTSARVIRADATNVKTRRRWAIRWTATAFIAVAASAALYFATTPAP